MILRDVRNDGNRYCGPAAISALTGISTTQAAWYIRQLTGKRKVQGTFDYEILPIIESFGYTATKIEHGEGETLGQWLDVSARHQERCYLISAGQHWQIVWQDKFVCGKTIIIVGIKNPYVPRKAKIKGVWEIKEATAL